MRGCFVSSDTGGAQEVGAIVRWLARAHPGLECRLFTDWSGHRVSGLAYTEVSATPDAVSAICDVDQPDFILTGTSLTPGLELLFVDHARRAGIVSLSAVDHWTSFARRFTGPAGRLILPDQIFVNDDEALARAARAGLPREILRVFGNPYFDEAARFQPARSREDVLGDLGLTGSRRVLLFLSDALTEVAGTESASVAMFGYSEMAIVKACLASLERLGRNGRFDGRTYELVIKLHPMEALQKYDELLSSFPREQPCRVTVVKQAPLWDLLYYADRIAGMFTAALLQAACLGRQPLRIELGAAGEDRLPLPRAAYFARVVDVDELDTAIARWLSEPGSGVPWSGGARDYETILAGLVTGLATGPGYPVPLRLPPS